MFRETVKAGAPLHLPQAYRAVEAGASEEQILVRIGRIGARWGPLDGVDFRLVGTQVVQMPLGFEAPHF